MAGTIIANRNRVERIREAILRYSLHELGDPAPIIEISRDEESNKLIVVVASPNFKNIPYTKRLKAIWDFLFADPDTNKDDLFEISRIMPESE
ncbi:MAG: hypothetical protein ACREOI_02830 [bacterium]